MTAEQIIKMAALGILAAIVVFTVLAVLVATLYFHSKKRPFSKQTTLLIKWLVTVLVCLFVASLGVSGPQIISALLK